MGHVNYEISAEDLLTTRSYNADLRSGGNLMCSSGQKVGSVKDVRG
jgi:hypothetical protein